MPRYRDTTEIGVIDTLLNHKDMLTFSDETNIPKSKLGMYTLPIVLAELAHLVCEYGFNSENLQNFLKEKNSFDIVLMERFTSDCFLSIAKIYRVPIVTLYTWKLLPWIDYRVGNPNNPAYVPNLFLSYSDKMNFFQRVENTLLNIFLNIYYNYLVVVNKDQRVSTKYFGELGATIHSDILNDSVILVNTHHTVNLPRPLVPNVVEIGGLHIGEKKNFPKVRYYNF